MKYRIEMFLRRVVARLAGRCDVCGLKSPSHKMDCSGSYRSAIWQSGWGP